MNQSFPDEKGQIRINGLIFLGTIIIEKFSISYKEKVIVFSAKSRVLPSFDATNLKTFCE